MSRIISIGTSVPEYGAEQSALFRFMDSVYDDTSASRKLNILFRKSGISKRYSVIPDFSDDNPNAVLFDQDADLPDVEKRLDIFREKAGPLAVEAINNSLLKINKSLKSFKITHLITVSCTGLHAPGIDTEIIGLLNLPEDIFHLQLNFIGCNAAFSALKIADMIAGTDDNAKVLIVCIELCTLHFQSKSNDDILLSNSIFGDGAACAIIVSDVNADEYTQKGLKINDFYSLLLSEGKDLMGWEIKPAGFEMILDPKVPEFISNWIDEIVYKASRGLNINKAKINKWAIHPGGRKILDTIKNKLHLNEADMRHSYSILEKYGNMSSATLLFVLDEIMHAEHNTGEKIFSIGFGPGLSIETSLFTYTG